MKNRIFVLFLFVFITGVFFCSLNYSFDVGVFDFKSLTTDSGFDADYGGSSSSSSSSDFDHDYDSDYNGGSDSSITINCFYYFVLIGVLSIFYVAFILAIKKRKICLFVVGIRTVAVIVCGFLGYYVSGMFFDVVLLVLYVAVIDILYFPKRSKPRTFSSDEIDSELLKKYGIYCTLDELKENVYNSYVKIQEAWSDNDIDKARYLLSDEIYNMYKMQITTMVNKNQRNVMSNFKYRDCYINKINYKGEKKDIIIKVSLNVSCKDYIEDINTSEVLRGKSYIINDYYYLLTFMISKKTNVKECPNCNSKIEDIGKSVKCKYCDSVIVRDTTDLVLIDKKMINQKIRIW